MGWNTGEVHSKCVFWETMNLTVTVNLNVFKLRNKRSKEKNNPETPKVKSKDSQICKFFNNQYKIRRKGPRTAVLIKFYKSGENRFFFFFLSFVSIYSITISFH